MELRQWAITPISRIHNKHFVNDSDNSKLTAPRKQQLTVHYVN